MAVERVGGGATRSNSTLVTSLAMTATSPPDTGFRVACYAFHQSITNPTLPTWSRREFFTAAGPPMAVFTQWRNPSESATPTCTWSSSARANMAHIWLDGADPENPVADSKSTQSSSDSVMSITVPSMTATRDGSRGLWIWAAPYTTGGSSRPLIPPSGYDGWTLSNVTVFSTTATSGVNLAFVTAPMNAGESLSLTCGITSNAAMSGYVAYGMVVQPPLGGGSVSQFLPFF